MEKNYYCNGKWFKSYDEATRYACRAITLCGTYYVIYTKAEMDSQVRGMVDSIINHEMECGK